MHKKQVADSINVHYFKVIIITDVIIIITSVLSYKSYK